MQLPRTEPAIEIFRRRENDGLPVDDRRLRRLVGSGEFVRVLGGSYARTSQWRALTPIDRHYATVIEAVDRARGPVTVSHFAAAAAWGMDMAGAWPARIDVLVPRTSGGRSSGAFRRHTVQTSDAQTIPWRGHRVTTPAQTAWDLARVLSFTGAVVAFDQALWRRRSAGPLLLPETLAAFLADRAGVRGLARVAVAAEFATGLSDSVRESESRVLIHRLGFPRPILQQRFELPSGRVAHPDFFFPEHDHAAEFDGTGKYLDPRLLAGRTPAQALLEEKDRGDELRRMVSALSRWRTPAIRDPRLLYDILSGDGLPTRRPRPPAGLVLR